MVNIRTATPDDAETIWQMFGEIVREGNAFLSDDNVTKKEVVSRWLSNNVVTYIAVLDGQPVGAYMMKPNYHGRGSHVANATYMVKSEWRGRGIGRKLGEHSLAAARELGYLAMQFNAVVSSNEAAVKLWQQLGFSIIGTVPKGFQEARLGLVDLYIMHRFL